MPTGPVSQSGTLPRTHVENLSFFSYLLNPQKFCWHPRPLQTFLQGREVVVRWPRSLSLQSVGTISSHMTLSASFLRELVDPNLSVGGRAKLGCGLARDFEDRGEYEKAREVLSPFWPGIGERPTLTGLERSTAADCFCVLEF